MPTLDDWDDPRLRRLAARLADRTGEFGDLFLEEARHAVVTIDGHGPAVATGAASGAAARRVISERVDHMATAGLEMAGLEAAAAAVRGGARISRPARSGGPAGAPKERRPRAGVPPGPAVGGPDDLDAIVAYLQEIEAAVTAADDRAAFRARAELHVQAVAVATSEGEVARDRRPWITFSARLMRAGRGGRPVAAVEGGGGHDPERLRALHPPAGVAAGLLRGLLEQESAAPAPAGAMTVVLAPGPGGIFFHEACGHALEGDRALKGRSAFVDRLGEMVGPPDLTLLDDPTLPGLPGSRRVDDEGWPAARNVLIESGRLVGLLLDRATALLAGTTPTGAPAASRTAISRCRA